jgi:FAD/FMN-containing dehydrogenase
VESLRVMRADGMVVRCSRTENAELFSLVLGGYGLFGIILDAELRVVPNVRYQLRRKVVPVEEALATYQASVKGNPDAAMVYARMNVSPDALLSAVILNVFTPAAGDAKPPPLNEPGLAAIRRAIFRSSADDKYGKELRWQAESKLDPLLAKRFYSRNQLLNEGVAAFENRSAETTDILHEYFVPPEEVTPFIIRTQAILRRRKPNLLNVTVRHLLEDQDTFLRYADRELFSFVMLFQQERTREAEVEMESLAQELIEAALKHHGRYYLPYRLHATPEQFARAYPQAAEFFAKKREYDPDQLFQNKFSMKYDRSADE